MYSNMLHSTNYPNKKEYSEYSIRNGQVQVLGILICSMNQTLGVSETHTGISITDLAIRNSNSSAVKRTSVSDPQWGFLMPRLAGFLSPLLLFLFRDQRHSVRQVGNWKPIN